MKILNRTCDGFGPSGYDVVTLSTFVLLNEEKKNSSGCKDVIIRSSDCFEILLSMVRADLNRQQSGITKKRVPAGRRERIDDSESVDLKASRSSTGSISPAPPYHGRTLLLAGPGGIHPGTDPLLWLVWWLRITTYEISARNRSRRILWKG